MWAVSTLSTRLLEFCLQAAVVSAYTGSSIEKNYKENRPMPKIESAAQNVRWDLSPIYSGVDDPQIDLSESNG